jgi:hypothetical protein
MVRKSLTRKSLTEKFYRGAFKLGAYLGAGSIAASLMGCDHLPVPISVSGERYVSYATTENGDVYSLKDGPYSVDPDTTMNLSLVTYDTVTNSVVNTHDLPSPPLMLTNSRNSAAYIVPGDNDSTNIAFLNEGRLKIIRDASFPQLSRTGDCLAYSRMEGDEMKMYLDFFKLGKVEKHRENGVPIAFSPDLRKLLFFGESEEKGGGALHYRHLSSGSSVHITDADFMMGNSSPNFPQWVDNDRVLYTAKPTESSTDEEIYVTDMRGNKTRITDNFLAEISPQISKEGVVFYVGKDIDDDGGTESPIHFSKTERGFWNSRQSDFSAQWLRVAGKNLIYARDGGQLFSTPLEDVVSGDTSHVINISKKVVAKEKYSDPLNDFLRAVLNK